MFWISATVKLTRMLDSHVLALIMSNERKKRNEIVLLGAELLGEDNLLFTCNILHLPLANLNSLLNGFQLLLKLRDFG
jgi:hypothetical protein